VTILLTTPERIGDGIPLAVKDDLETRGAVIRFTYPFDAPGWPALASRPC